MKCRTGFLSVACVWTVILMPSLDAGRAPMKRAAAVSCRAKELTALTRHLVEESLTSFDEANGRHLGTWSPGFPELQVHQNSPLLGSKCQCSLLFMARGLGEVLEDQRSNLNPQDVSLHKKLGNAVATVDLLTACAKATLGGECSPVPPPPKMPKHAFDRKQWSHTLLKAAKDYLGWMERKLQVPKVDRKHKIKRAEVTLQRHLEGSGYLL